jgi:glycosyltransferase involved in cell wall biosynthesis
MLAQSVVQTARPSSLPMVPPAYTDEAPAARAAAGTGLRIAVFMHDFARTGVVANAVRLANALAARGHRVTLLACSGQGREAHRIDAGVQIEVACGVAPGEWSRPLALLLALPALRRRLRWLQPDILLSAGNHGHLPAMVASRGLPGLRRVLRISNDLDHAGDSLPVRRGRRLLQRFLIARADRLLLVSAHLARHPLLEEALAEGKAVVAANGVAVEEVQRRAAAACRHPWLDGPVPVVLAMGRLTRQKNFATLIRAFARATQARPLKLIIVGGGARAERLRLERLAAQLGMHEQLRFEGELENPFPLLAGARAFVLPSLWEGASNALLEALACGVPVVAARSAGNAPEVLGYGRFGLLVDPLDVAGMAAAILYQTGEDPTRPANRAAEFAAAAMLARTCNAVTGEDTPPSFAPAAALPGRP